MKPYAPLSLLAILLSLAASASGNEPKKGYSAFPLVQTRNVFDPDRQPGRPTVARTSAPTSRPSFITLTGAMVTQEKKLAFFTGSRAEFNKVITVKDTLADFTVTRISATAVELQLYGKPIVVAVGTQVPLDGSTASAPGPASSDPTPAANPSPAAAATPTETNDILRRMMERRKTELSK